MVNLDPRLTQDPTQAVIACRKSGFKNVFLTLLNMDGPIVDHCSEVDVVLV